MANKRERQSAILEIVEQRAVSSQEDLRNCSCNVDGMLRRRRCPATFESSVSRACRRRKERDMRSPTGTSRRAGQPSRPCCHNSFFASRV